MDHLKILMCGLPSSMLSWLSPALVPCICNTKLLLQATMFMVWGPRSSTTYNLPCPPSLHEYCTLMLRSTGHLTQRLLHHNLHPQIILLLTVLPLANAVFSSSDVGAWFIIPIVIYYFCYPTVAFAFSKQELQPSPNQQYKYFLGSTVLIFSRSTTLHLNAYISCQVLSPLPHTD